MAKISMGRRLLMALPTSIALMLIFWIIGTIASNIMPSDTFPTLFPETCGGLGFILGIAEQMVADFKAKLSEKEPEG